MSSSKTSAARMRSTARRSSPISSHAVGDPPYVTAEQFEIRSTNISRRTVLPGETLAVTASYGSDLGSFLTRFDIDTDHPDYCTVDRFGFSPGASLYLRVRSATASRGNDTCWLATNNDSATETLEVAAPTTAGQHTVTIELVGNTTQRVYDSDTIQINVDDQASEPPDDPNDDNRVEGGDEEEEEEEDDSALDQNTIFGIVAIVAAIAGLALS